MKPGSLSVLVATAVALASSTGVAGLAEPVGDVHSLNSGDLARLASRGAKKLSGCKGLSKGTTLALTEVSNRTDEHVDKSVLIESLKSELAKRAGVTLTQPASDAPAAAPGLTAILTMEKTETAKSYLGRYHLELTAPACKVTADLEKKQKK